MTDNPMNELFPDDEDLEPAFELIASGRAASISIPTTTKLNQHEARWLAMAMRDRFTRAFGDRVSGVLAYGTIKGRDGYHIPSVYLVDEPEARERVTEAVGRLIDALIVIGAIEDYDTAGAIEVAVAGETMDPEATPDGIKTAVVTMLGGLS